MAINLAAAVNRQHPLNRSRDAWWLPISCIQVPGLRLRDVAGNLPATFTGTTTWYTVPGSGWPMYSPDYAGGIYAQAGTTSTLNYSRSFTLSVTFRFNGNAGALGLLSHGGGGIYLRTNSSKVNFLKSATADIASASTTLNSGEWYHAMVTLDNAATANGAFYLNGKQDGTFTTGLTFSGSSVINIGSDAGSEIWPDRIAAVSMWSRALSADECYQEYLEWRTGWRKTLNQVKLHKAMVYQPAAGSFKVAWARNANTMIQPLVSA